MLLKKFTVKIIICDNLNSIYEQTILKTNVPEQKIFLRIHFMTAHANKFNKFEVGKLVSQFYSQIDCSIIFTSEFSIDSFFHFKEKIPC